MKPHSVLRLEVSQSGSMLYVLTKAMTWRRSIKCCFWIAYTAALMRSSLARRESRRESDRATDLFSEYDITCRCRADEEKDPVPQNK